MTRWSTDKRNPTVNANGALYGCDREQHRLPAGAGARERDRDHREDAGARSQDPTTYDDPMLAPSPNWGDEKIWNSQSIVAQPDVR